MAKMQGITGKLSGKMGAAVFRVRDGLQVVSQYNPIVKNPNTEGQQTQRAKFKLMAQLAAVMSPGFGTMAITKRPARGKPSQRNAFTQLNMPLVEVSSDNDIMVAKIPMEEVQLTSSFRDLPPIQGGASGNFIDATIDNITADVAKIRFVLVDYRNNVPAIVDLREVPVVDGGADYVNNIISPGKYTLLAFGLIPSESAKASIDLDNIHTIEDEDFVSAVELNAMVEAGMMAETKTVGYNVTITGA